MKKIIVLIVTVVMTALLLGSCGLGKCDGCGKTGFLTEYSAFGSTIYLCKDCNR